MQWSGRNGATLLEMLIVIAISGVIVAGTALHVRTLRKVSELSSSRRLASQNGGTAVARIARSIRAASAVAEVSAPDNDAGAITVTDAEGVNHVFELSGTELLYGVDSASDVLATGIASLSFRGRDSEGTVSEDNPGDMDAVSISLKVAIADGDETVDLHTTARLRRVAREGDSIRSVTTYANTYQDKGAKDFTWPGNALGEPDDLFARLSSKGSSGSYGGFSQSEYTGTVHLIQVGMRLRYHRGELNTRIKYNGRHKLIDEEFKRDDLESFSDSFGWLWIDLTDSRSSWTHSDIPLLEIEVSAKGRSTDIEFDSFAVRAYFDEPETNYVWADSEGDGSYPNEWISPTNAFGAPDGYYAIEDWDDENRQSFTATPAAGSDEILAVHVAFYGYVAAPYNRKDELKLRLAFPGEGERDGNKYELDRRILDDFVGSDNEGVISVDVTSDREWTWHALDTCEIRAEMKKDKKGPTTFMVDSVGWKVTHAASGGARKGIGTWQEQ